jgi:putative endonuclease
MATKDILGRRGEQLAADYLTAHGYRIIERNWRCNLGEIDLIAAGGGHTVFVEVKTRTTTAYGHPFQAVTVTKLARLRRLAAIWRAQAPRRFGRIRVDVIGIVAPPGAPVSIEHLKGVF